MIIGRFQKQQSDIFPSPALEDLRGGIGSIPHFRGEPTDFRGFLFADPSTAVQGGGNGHRGNTGFPGNIFQADSFLILHIPFSVRILLLYSLFSGSQFSLRED